ncbi:outer membrane protein with beta-barrel domain [Chitinophaga dinghuensis]|uniref:Outer membrane protein with beta-barrel domain n=1 Tax=Chitinophaga dinghuensis TaxID=1539050 RepID=A0A327W548_9BACT|nr:porin family protein [Chitinophaga dinghuensis]RAJ83506.1 outer membrane protein with beta-barrel domain [Chitinophaga dinghuensis]
MKKLILSGVLAIGAFLSTQAQSIHFGLKGGLNIDKMTNTDNAKTQAGFHVGGFVNIGLTKEWAIQPELLYSGQGVKKDNPSPFADVTLKTDYLNIPVMIQYSIVPSFYLEAGPQVGILVGAKQKIGSNSKDVKNQLSGADFGLGFGCGYKFDCGFGVSGRYMFGITNAVNSDYSNSTSKNSVAQVGVFYQF